MGKIFKDEYVFNKESLEFYIKKICVEHQDTYFAELMNDIEVLKLIDIVVAKYGYLINKDVVEGICKTEIMLLTWYEFNIALANQQDLANSFWAFLYSRIFFRVNEQIKKERPTIFSSKSIQNVKDEFEERGYSKYKYEYIEILSGDIFDLNNVINPCYKQNDFDKVNDNDNFNRLIEDLNDNQKNIIIKIYKDKATEAELSKENNVSHQSIHKAKKKALKNIKKKLGVAKIQKTQDIYYIK